jgi:predicted metal-dependent peptidase
MTIPSDSELEHMLEFVKKDVFLSNNAAFLGSLMCSHEFVWDMDGSIVPDTAGTDGLHVWWDVKHFLRISIPERGWTIQHEIWHTGLLHFLRRGDRNNELWNIACDIRINNNLIRNGIPLPSNGDWLFDLSLDNYGILSEEQIYDLLVQNKIPKPKRIPSDIRMPPGPMSPIKQQAQMAAVVRAVQAAEISGQAGNLPGNLREVLNTFLSPRVPWRSVLAQWATDILDELEYTWNRPNRRYQDIYLPGLEDAEGRLDHLAYFLDVSGSITKQDEIRFVSELKHVKEVLKPKKLTVLQFDIVIQSTRVFEEWEPFEHIEIVGGGGTSLAPVRKWINENQPKAAVIFSDLDCPPMKPLKVNIPIIWAAIRNKNAVVPFGTLIHIAED